jgi:hypothetical protein
VRHLDRINGKFRTDDLAIVAVDTIFRLQHRWGMISLFVETFGKSQNFTGTKFDTIPTPFAAVFDDIDLSLTNLYRRGIERHSPELHGSLHPATICRRSHVFPNILNDFAKSEAIPFTADPFQNLAEARLSEKAVSELVAIGSLFIHRRSAPVSCLAKIVAHHIRS